MSGFYFLVQKMSSLQFFWLTFSCCHPVDAGISSPAKAGAILFLLFSYYNVLMNIIIYFV